MSDRDWPWQRVTGLLGICFFVGIAVVLLGFFGPIQPDPDGSIEEIREFIDDDGALLQTGNWIASFTVLFFFLPFAAGLRAVLSENDVDAGMWTRTAFGAAIGIIAVGGAGSAFLSSAELAFSSGELDDGLLRLMVWADAFTFTVTIGTGVALFLVANCLVVLRTKALWSWLGWSGLVIALIGLVGAWWPLDGDPGGALAILSYVTLPLLAIWSLLVGFNLLSANPSERD